MELVSVIVPVYNVEAYLPKCVESLLSQTYPNLEVILVDDASPDDCPQICDQYAQRDARVKAIHKKVNAGLGEARNTGLGYASGTYVYFADSDDWLESKMLETMVQAMEQHEADLVMEGFKRCSSQGKSTVFQVVQQSCVWDGDDVQRKVLLPMVAQKSEVREDFTINMCVWTNLYRNSIIQKNHICFLSEREYLSEDICFNLEYLLHTARVVMLPNTDYCYRYNPNSLTSRYKGPEYDMLVSLYKKVCEIVDQIEISGEPEFRKERFFLTKIREVLFRLANSNLPFIERVKICKNILSDTTLQMTLSKYPIKDYAKKYKIPAILMQKRMSAMTIMLFWLTPRFRKR